MNSGGKIIVSMLLIVTMLTFTAYKLSTMLYDKTKEDYESAVQFASQAATLKLVDTSDINTMYDGNVLTANMNLDAMKYFRNELVSNLKSRAQSNVAPSNLEIPLVGLVGNEYIIGMYSDGSYLPPLKYYKYINNSNIPSEIGGVHWRVTMDGALYLFEEEYRVDENNIATAVELTDTEGNLVTYDLSDYFDDIGFENFEQFKTYIITLCIEDYINMFIGKGINNTANNTGKGLNILMGKSKDNERMSLIDGPTMFAIIDVYKGTHNSSYMYDRITAFGGAELVARQ